MFEIEYEFREQDLIHFNEMQFMRNEEIQNNIKKNRWIVPGIMALIGSFYYFYYADFKSSAYIFVIAVLWAFLSPKIMMLDLHRQILKNYTDKEKVNMFGTYTLTIDPANPNYLLEKSPSGKHKMAWSDLVRVEYGKRYVYIFINLNTALVIPVDTVKKGNLEQFAEQADKMIERAA
ncbi:YcxB family protein [Candidatus Methylobacter oryzae]|uniref:YcxB family protein n=1 Tax=Candidatus Methylobacter oryzae TaxID=2497749 RepID=A0ABY3CMZ9_9GAMM|nr:YcxB family protein [Candidatus Methylobacter oryzae]TRX03555.1 YcxB family protein [Candidatus Methylobacter oryzae]